MTELFDDQPGDEELEEAGTDALEAEPLEDPAAEEDVALEDPYEEAEPELGSSLDAPAEDDALDEWLSSGEPEEADPAAAEPGSVGALSDVELDSWLGSTLEEAPGAPSEEELVDRTVEERSNDE